MGEKDGASARNQRALRRQINKGNEADKTFTPEEIARAETPNLKKAPTANKHIDKEIEETSTEKEICDADAALRDAEGLGTQPRRQVGQNESQSPSEGVTTPHMACQHGAHSQSGRGTPSQPVQREEDNKKLMEDLANAPCGWVPSQAESGREEPGSSNSSVAYGGNEASEHHTQSYISSREPAINTSGVVERADGAEGACFSQGEADEEESLRQEMGMVNSPLKSYKAYKESQTPPEEGEISEDDHRAAPKWDAVADPSKVNIWPGRPPLDGEKETIYTKEELTCNEDGKPLHDVYCLPTEPHKTRAQEHQHYVEESFQALLEELHDEWEHEEDLEIEQHSQSQECYGDDSDRFHQFSPLPCCPGENSPNGSPTPRARPAQLPLSPDTPSPPSTTLELNRCTQSPSQAKTMILTSGLIVSFDGQSRHTAEALISQTSESVVNAQGPLDMSQGSSIPNDTEEEDQLLTQPPSAAGPPTTATGVTVYLKKRPEEDTLRRTCPSVPNLDENRRITSVPTKIVCLLCPKNMANEARMLCHLKTDHVSHPTESLINSTKFQKFLLDRGLKCCLKMPDVTEPNGGCRGIYSKDRAKCAGCTPRRVLEDPVLPFDRHIANQVTSQQANAFIASVEVPDSYYTGIVEKAFQISHSTVLFVPHKLSIAWGSLLTDVLKMVNHDCTSLKPMAILCCLSKAALSQNLFDGSAPVKRGPMSNYNRIKSAISEIRKNKSAVFTIIERLIAEDEAHCPPARKAGDTEAAIKKAVIKKAEMGNYGAGIQILDSKGMAPDDATTLKALQDLHPEGKDFQMPPTPATEKWEFEGGDVVAIIASLRMDGAGGASGLKPAHLKTAMKAEAEVGSSALADELAKFSSNMANGSLNQMISPYISGGRLFALKKSDTDASKIRPIGAGEMFMKIPQKMMLKKEMSNISSKLLATDQIATGVKRGAEAAAHAMQHIWDTLTDEDEELRCDPSKIYIGTTDLAAAYQNIDQGLIMNELAANFPRFFALTRWMVDDDINMFYNGKIIKSKQGVTQGSVFGGLLFCAGFAAMERKITTALGGDSGVLYRQAFADDTLFIAPLEAHTKRLQILMEQGPNMGIHLNKSKSQVIMPVPSEDELDLYPTEFKRLKDGIVVLGAPVGSDKFVQDFLDERINKVEKLLDKTKELGNTQVMALLARYCIQGPKMAHLMYSTNPETAKRQWQRYDEISSRYLEALVGCPLKPQEWELATLPKGKGGLGFTSFPDQAATCFVTSLSASQNIQKHLLRKFHHITPERSIRNHSAASIQIAIQLENATITKDDIDNAIKTSAIPSMNLKQLLIEKKVTKLTVGACKTMKAVLLSGSGSGAGAWLDAQPYAKTKLENGTTSTALKLRLGMKTSERRDCSCGHTRDEYGVHALVCKKGFRTERHNKLRDEFNALAKEAGLDSETEPDGYSMGLDSDGKTKRVDVLIRNWSGGKNAGFDIGVTCPTSIGNVNRASKTALISADAYAKTKNEKYLELCQAQNILFVPLVVETHGAWTLAALQVFKRLADFTAVKLRITTAKAYEKIIERMSAVLQIGNAKMINAQI